MVKSMLTGMSEYYSAELSEKVVRGMTENVLKGKYNGGTIPIVVPLKGFYHKGSFQRVDLKELLLIHLKTNGNRAALLPATRPRMIICSPPSCFAECAAR